MRCGRSERAGDLKASNITPPLEWTTTSMRLTLPTAAVGLGFVQDVAEFLDLVGCLRKYETRLTTGSQLRNGVETDLELLELDADVCVFSIEAAVAMDLTREAPVIMVNKGIVEKGEVNGGAHHKEPEPWQKRVRRH